MSPISKPLLVDLLVSQSVSASSLYGLYDVLASVGVGWETYVSGEPPKPRFHVRIVSDAKATFYGLSGAQITPNVSIEDADGADIVGSNLAVRLPWALRRFGSTTRRARSG
jgi:hypothetical protein